MNENVALVYLSRWPESSDTHRTMRSALDQLARKLGGKDAETYPWDEIRYARARGIPGKLADLEPATINKMLSALRGVLETAHSMGLIPDDDYARIKIESVRGKARPAGRALTAEEKQLVLAHVLNLPPQEAALLAVMLGAGARRVEVVKVKRDDYNPTTGRITLYGKGRKPRSVPVGRHWRALIEEWQATLVGAGKSALMFDMTRRQVSYIVERFYKSNGMKAFTPHDLRRTFGTHVCEVADAVIAQKLLGHSDIKTTMLYDRRGEKAEDEAVEDW